MRNTAMKISLEQESDEICSYAVQSFSEEELERAGKIFDQIKSLKSPHKEQEFIRLVLAHDCSLGNLRH